MLEEALIDEVLAIQQQHYQENQASDSVDDASERHAALTEPDMSLDVEWDAVEKLSLELTPGQITALRAKIERAVRNGKAQMDLGAAVVDELPDPHRDELEDEEEPRTSWGDFLLHLSDALRSVYLGQSSTFEEEWSSVSVGASDDSFWYNKRSGESQWHQPHISLGSFSITSNKQLTCIFLAPRFASIWDSHVKQHDRIRPLNCHKG